jgi:hypothetical protein
VIHSIVTNLAQAEDPESSNSPADDPTVSANTIRAALNCAIGILAGEQET